MNDKELRDAAVAELHKTTTGYQSFVKKGAVPGPNTAWGKGLALLEQIGQPLPPPAGSAPEYAVLASPAPNLIYGWAHHASPSTPTGQWGGIAVRRLDTAISWRWYAIYELTLDAGWPDSASTYGLPLDAHNVPGDVGWDTGVLTSALHLKVRNLQLFLQHEPNFPQNEWPVSPLTKARKHVVELDLTLGRTDGTTPQSGRTVVWVDGARMLDTRDVNNLQRLNNVNQSKMDILDGLYCQGISAPLRATFTAGRWGRTRTEAVADVPVYSGMSSSPSVVLK